MKITKKEEEFLRQSNRIESVYGNDAYDDSVDAWKYAIENIDNLNVDYILKIHYHLMKRLNKRIAGKFRTCDVWIGGVRKIFISTSIIELSVKQCLEKIQESLNNEIGKEEITKKMHIQFEGAHPFEDGNGRVGRILYNIHRLKMNLPIHIIHEKDKYNYYEWFKLRK